MGDNGKAGKGVEKKPGGQVVVVVKMGDQQKTHRLVGPLADLGDVLVCVRGPVAGVDDEDLTGSDDDSGVAARGPIVVVAVLDRVNAFRQTGDPAGRLSRHGPRCHRNDAQCPEAV